MHKNPTSDINRTLQFDSTNRATQRWAVNKGRRGKKQKAKS